MAREDTDYSEQTLALLEEFAGLLPGRLDRIDELWRALAGDWDGDQLRELIYQVHLLSGSASTFGYPELGRIALSLEQRLKSWSRPDHPPSGRTREEVADELAALRRSADRSVPVEPVPVLAPPPPSPQQVLVYLIEDDELLARELHFQLAAFGYLVKKFASTRGVGEAVAAEPPQALVIDIAFPEGDLAGLELLEELRRDVDLKELPALFITARDDFDARMAAARCGGAAYFVKPLDVIALVDQLNRLTQRHWTEPFRILIVDDDRTLAEHYALVLRRAGMHVAVLTEPRRILERLDEEVPELVLMDIVMPGHSGLELVNMIRQHDRFVSLPIVYLSTETDIERQLSALRLGGDDFLTKPLSDRHLLAAVSVRAERSRVLRALMTRDSLTGLLSHVPLKERLAAEMARTRRRGSPLAFAMLDVDDFKQVNDRYGHLVGDRVLRSLANLLEQRVRKSDTVGRYGGEEFGIVLPDCSVANALELMSSLIESFRGIRFRSGGRHFHVTFSAGVAGAETGVSLDELVDRADRALYRAKVEGRSRAVAGR